MEPILDIFSALESSRDGLSNRFKVATLLFFWNGVTIVEPKKWTFLKMAAIFIKNKLIKVQAIDSSHSGNTFHF